MKRSRLQLFLSISEGSGFCGATALTEKNRDDPAFEMRMESGGLHAQFEGIIVVSMRSSKESSRLFSVRAVAPPNLLSEKSCERERCTMRMGAAAQ